MPPGLDDDHGGALEPGEHDFVEPLPNGLATQGAVSFLAVLERVVHDHQARHTLPCESATGATRKEATAMEGSPLGEIVRVTGQLDTSIQSQPASNT